MNFEVTITMTVEADSQMDALQLGTNAAEHLIDTFNDDGSLMASFAVDVKKAEE